MLRSLISRFALLSLLVVFLFIPGCLQICGQRITIFYDAQRDILNLLIYYDGVFDSGSIENGNGSEQLTDAFNDGDILLVDWPFELDMSSVKEAAAEEGSSEAGKIAAQAIVDDIHAKPVGRYRNPKGEIGFLQHVTITHATRFFESINTAICKALIEESANTDFDSTDQDMPETAKKWLTAAKNNHQWLRINGHSIEFTAPVHSREYSVLKVGYIKSLISLIDDDKIEGVSIILNAICLAPISYEETLNKVTFRIGDSDNPTTVRLLARDEVEYTDNLEEQINNMKFEELSDLLIKQNELETKPADDSETWMLNPVELALKYGPAEQVIWSYIKKAEKTQDPWDKQDALEWMDTYAEMNKETILGYPPLSKDEAAAEETIKLWVKWCRQMYDYPIEWQTEQ